MNKSKPTSQITVDSLPQTKTTKLFTYGSLIRGLHNNKRMLSNQKFIRQSSIIGNYILFHCGWSYPFLANFDRTFGIEIDKPEEQTTIKGEVYEIDSECLKNLDIMEFGAGYERRTVLDTHKEEVQLYVLKSGVEISNKIFVQSGDWLDFVKKTGAAPYYPEINYYNVRDSKGRFCKKCFVIKSSEKTF